MVGIILFIEFVYIYVMIISNKSMDRVFCKFVPIVAYGLLLTDDVIEFISERSMNSP